MEKKNENMDLFIIGSLIFGIQKESQWPALPHHTHFAPLYHTDKQGRIEVCVHACNS